MLYNCLTVLSSIFPIRQNFSFNQASVRTASSIYGFTYLITRTFYRLALVSTLFKPPFSSPAQLLLVPSTDWGTRSYLSYHCSTLCPPKFIPWHGNR